MPHQHFGNRMPMFGVCVGTWSTVSSLIKMPSITFMELNKSTTNEHKLMVSEVDSNSELRVQGKHVRHGKGERQMFIVQYIRSSSIPNYVCIYSELALFNFSHCTCKYVFLRVDRGGHGCLWNSVCV